MDGVGSLGQMVETEAFIQAKIGEFLGLKQKLVELMRHPSITIKARADALLKTQQRMEVELNVALQKLEEFKKGTWTSAFELGEFSNRLVRHINKVKALQRDAGHTVADTRPLFAIDWQVWAIPVAILAVPFLSRLIRR